MQPSYLSYCSDLNCTKKQNVPKILLFGPEQFMKNVSMAIPYCVEGVCAYDRGKGAELNKTINFKRML